MKKLCFAVALAALFSGGLFAQNDTWEPNNSAIGAAPFASHTGASGEIAGLSFQIGPPAGGPATQTCELALDMAIIAGDDDWYSVTAPTSGSLTVHLRQTSFTNHRLVCQILNQAGTQVLAGPSAGTYQQLSSSPTVPAPAPYDGARAQANVTLASSYRVRVFYPVGGTPIPANTAVNYQLSLEWGNPDASEGTYSNNFPGARPAPGTGQEADASPTAPGAANAKVLTNRSYQGYDYYVVQTTQPATISFQIENLVPLAATFNFDVYWVRANGTLFPTYNGTALQGAEDSFPNGWSTQTFPAVVGGPPPSSPPRATETIITPPLAPGAYYFHVLCWDLSAGIALPQRGGTYGIRVILTGVTDDALEGVGLNQNDTPDKAFLLPAGTTNNLKLLNDPNNFAEEDWYKVQVNNGSSVEVRLVVTAPITDNLDIRLYKPSTVTPATPGIVTDLIDMSQIDNTEAVTKGNTTAREIVGTWGTVGTNGNASLPDGYYLVRITQGNLLINCGYSLIVTIPTTANVAPDDTHEPLRRVDNTFANAFDTQHNYVDLAPGLNTGLKAMDSQDWYRFPAARNKTVEITLQYDAGPDTDIDLLLYDLNGGPDVATGGPPSLAGAPNFTAETQPSSFAVVQTAAGTAWVAAGKIAPNTGTMFLLVQRWGTRGCRYSLNINVDNNNPLPPLVADTIATNPAAVAVPASTNVTVNIRNIGVANATLQTLDVSVIHSSGADITNQFTITAPTPTLPEIVNAGQTNQYQFTVSSTPNSTTGVATVYVNGTTSTGQGLLGTPTATFTVTGGVPPAPLLVYSNIAVSGTLSPGGVANVTATVHNQGTQGGTFDDNGLAFAWNQGSGNVTTGFTAAGKTPPPPVLVGAGTLVDVTFTFGMKDTLALGLTKVTISGGGAQNPVNPGIGNFEIKPQFSFRDKPDGGGCVVGTVAPFAPGAFAVMLAGVAMFRRRRR